MLLSDQELPVGNSIRYVEQALARAGLGFCVTNWPFGLSGKQKHRNAANFFASYSGYSLLSHGQGAWEQSIRCNTVAIADLVAATHTEGHTTMEVTEGRIRGAAAQQVIALVSDSTANHAAHS